MTERVTITLDDIRQRFADICEGSGLREAVSSFAFRAMEADDRGLLEMEEPHSETIWKAVVYFSGVDLKIAPDQYLHSTDDFVAFRKGLGL